MSSTSSRNRTTHAANPRRDHYQEVTDRIIAALEAGTPPWRKPWDPDKAGGPAMPCNATTGQRYRGIKRPSRTWWCLRRISKRTTCPTLRGSVIFVEGSVDDRGSGLEHQVRASRRPAHLLGAHHKPGARWRSSADHSAEFASGEIAQEPALPPVCDGLGDDLAC
jgi:hypothetical protein